MADNATTTEVLVIDPNDVNINTNLPNGIPQYQDMNIFAELTAERKGRTMLTKNGGADTDNKVSVNFIGINQNTNNPDYLKFTTNYYDGSTTGNDDQYESFGIQSIKIIVNSSYVPQVNIVFVDLRGLSFFNQEDSKYRILFDFPPPIFTLTVKGYYGRSLKYDLHLVKYTTEFKAENGNFVIDANFVAMTFAPLTDVLFRYAVNAPLLKWNFESVKPDTKLPPKNTFEFIAKLKNLYTALNNSINSSEETKEYDDNLVTIDKLNTAFELIQDPKTAMKEDAVGAPLIFTIENIDEENTQAIDENSLMVLLSNVSSYDPTVAQLGTDTNYNNVRTRLYIGYAWTESRAKEIDASLNIYSEKLISYGSEGTSGSINKIDIKVPSTYENYTDITNETTRSGKILLKYRAIDVTNYYIKLCRSRVTSENKKEELSSKITTIINNAIEVELGMKPTIYNVFKLILDDVDTFFDAVKTSSNLAELHHDETDNKSIFLKYAGMEDFKNKIYAYPLVVDTETNVNGSTNTNIKTRIAPIELNKQFKTEMPEMRLVYDFIDTFVKQKEYNKTLNMLTQTNDDGTNVWIPISPIDSMLVKSGSDSPYYGKTVLNDILNVFINRFYVLTQFAIPSNFYGIDDYFFDDKSVISENYIKLFAASEAKNMNLSIAESNTKKNLKFWAGKFKSDVQVFYKYLNDNSKEIPNYNLIANSVAVINDAYRHKENPEYVGVTIYNDTDGLGIQTLNENGSKPLEKFAADSQRNFFEKIFLGNLPTSSFEFTNQNLIYIRDTYLDGDEKTDEGVTWKNLYLTTRFVGKYTHIKFDSSRNDMFSNTGNIAFQEVLKLPTPTTNRTLKSLDNVVDSWVKVLTYNDKSIYDDVIKEDVDEYFASMIYLSNFGLTLSPFNIYPKNLGPVICQTPSVVQVPNYLPAYLGGLIYAKKNGYESKLKAFFEKNQYLYSYYFFADYWDANENLSEKDRIMFQKEFERFVKNSFEKIRNGLNQAYNSVDEAKPKSDSDKEKLYEDLLNPTDPNRGTYFTQIFNNLLYSRYLLIYSENTFKIKAYTKDYYESLASATVVPKEGQEDTATTIILKKYNKQFFEAFFNNLFSDMTLDEDEKAKEEDEQKKLTGDKDIVTQMYYSLKTINDKWLTNPKTTVYGYPYNNGNHRLIDSFVFVDRAMNPIGNTVINPEILIELFADTDASIFTVLSQLLSLNGFLFFPLQNFMTHDINGWKETFLINTEVESTYQQAFICMYAGGSASYPSNIGGTGIGFVNDGMESVDELNDNGFGSVMNDEQTMNNPDFPWKKVRAFTVGFGQQNQSMFTDIKVDSKEFPETNESIQILARLAGDDKNNAPVQKAQNLYNLYENRAYSTTVTGLGNMMIQPTQYFQLNNIPLYNGPYLILSVEHNITANKMMTSFTGTKILKFPVPRVLECTAVLGFEGTAVGKYLSNNNNNGNKVTHSLNIPKDIAMNVATVLKRGGITNKYTIASIIAVAYKESGLIPKSELSYKKTSNSRIREIFTKRVEGLNEDELYDLKFDDIGFFDRVYGLNDPTGNGIRYGNTVVGDGYKYRGRGLNQLTFKSNYKTYGTNIGVDLVTYPEKANETNVAYMILSSFFLTTFNSHKKIMKSRFGVTDINGFGDINTAYEAMYNINAGLGNNTITSNDPTGGKAIGRKAADDVYAML